MPRRLLLRVRKLLRSEPRRRLGGFERRRIVTMIDAGASHGTLIRQHGYTRAEVDRAILAHVGRLDPDYEG
jgi:hypothetical protein